MDDALQRKLVGFAATCRGALESLSTVSGSKLYGFPKGSCLEASELVVEFLHSHLGLRATYASGTSHPAWSWTATHAWAEVDEYIIDITHDQFPELSFPGWVLPMQHEWYTGFQSVYRRVGPSRPERHWSLDPHGYKVLAEVLGG